MLLESLYSHFDRVAIRLGIFKVETIGDCYMAVCGVPDPRADHAVIMAQFALEMQLKLLLVRNKLSRRLGEDVRRLNLRTGLHSGPVTAGVIRGQRARFQLFGDTVNTASRMESTSVAGKIQISVATAELLIAGGRGDWIEKREDMVQAKGKGTLQTYWLVGDAQHQAKLAADEREVERDRELDFGLNESIQPIPEEPYVTSTQNNGFVISMSDQEGRSVHEAAGGVV
jgi:class 3 adenylate cyclase